MIARTHRFHGHNSLHGVYARGQTVRAPLISLKFLVRDPRRSYRVAVVVSRKVNRSAVVRARIRRRIYEIVRRQEHGIAAGTDLVFTVFGDELATLEARKLERLISGLLRKTAHHPGGPSPRGPNRAHGIVKSEGK